MSNARYKILVRYDAQHGIEETIDSDDPVIRKDLVPWGWDHLSQCEIYADVDTPSPVKKFDDRGNHKRKVEFETVLAISVLKSAKMYLPLMHKIGESIQAYFEKHLKSQYQAAAGKIFKDFLFTDSPYFGPVGYARNASSNPQKNFKEGMIELTRGKQLEGILSAHLAAQRIFKELLFSRFTTESSQHQRYHYYKNTVRASDLFAANRGRVKAEHTMPAPRVSTPGIEINLSPTSRSRNFSIREHARAADKFSRDHDNVSPFAFNAAKKEIPFIAGPSGTAGECFMAVKILAENTYLSPEEFQEYVFCCMGFLVSAGAHSFHEIYVIAELLGVPYEEGKYEAAIPSSFKQTKVYQELLNDFPDIIQLVGIRASLVVENSSSSSSSLFSSPVYMRSITADFDEAKKLDYDAMPAQPILVKAISGKSKVDKSKLSIDKYYNDCDFDHNNNSSSSHAFNKASSFHSRSNSISNLNLSSSSSSNPIPYDSDHKRKRDAFFETSNKQSGDNNNKSHSNANQPIVPQAKRQKR
jgi:hypothetical protein